MKALVGSLDRDTVAKAYKRFRSRIEAVSLLTAISMNFLILNKSLCKLFYCNKLG